MKLKLPVCQHIVSPSFTVLNGKSVAKRDALNIVLYINKINKIVSK